MDQLERTLRQINAPLTLDVATGSGNFASHLRTQYDGIGTIIGIDFSLTGYVRSKENFEKISDMLFACMDSSAIAFPDDSLDLVCISNSLHHMSELDGTLKEMLRVLKPGGYFLVSEMYRDNQTEAQMTHVLMHEWWASIDTLHGVPHFSTFPRQDILDLCRGLGLEEFVSADYSSLEENPMDGEVIKHLDAAIDAYIGRTCDLEDNSELRATGEELRERLHSVGFHGATTLAVLGRKPVV
jgi:SAM-dependent methyltransferase